MAGFRDLAEVVLAVPIGIKSLFSITFLTYRQDAYDSDSKLFLLSAAA
jgi:hypothetical protein